MVKRSLVKGIWVPRDSRLSWLDYLPPDIKEVVEEWYILDPAEGSTEGLEIYYSPRRREFYKREWFEENRDSGREKPESGSFVKLLSEEEVVNLIVEKGLARELNPGWQLSLKFREQG